MRTNINGTMFETGRDRHDVTSLHRPDLTWRVVDAHGHEHRWHADGQLATHYQGDVAYDVPTLVDVHDGWGYYEDGERYALHHFECRQCGERIEPRSTADSNRVYMGGPVWFRIDGQDVAREEYERRYSAAIGGTPA